MDESTPATVPSKEKLTSPSIPTMNPSITTNRVRHVKKLVVLPSRKKVKTTLKTIDSDLATLSAKKRSGEGAVRSVEKRTSVGK
jgi:hypothetical protein